MKTLEELIVDKKCRKGDAFAKTKDGAFWLAIPELNIRSFGGNGIGNSSTSWDCYLQLRHYRSGEVRAVVKYHSWHQNYGSSDRYKRVDILGCTTVEDVISILLASASEEQAAYSSYYEERLTESLTNLGMMAALPAPDEIA